MARGKWEFTGDSEQFMLIEHLAGTGKLQEEIETGQARFVATTEVDIRVLREELIQ